MKIKQLVKMLNTLDPELDIDFQTPDNWIYGFDNVHVGYVRDGREINPNEDGIQGTYRIAMLSE